MSSLHNIPEVIWMEWILPHLSCQDLVSLCQVNSHLYHQFTDSSSYCSTMWLLWRQTLDVDKVLYDLLYIDSSLSDIIVQTLTGQDNHYQRVSLYSKLRQQQIERFKIKKPMFSENQVPSFKDIYLGDLVKPTRKSTTKCYDPRFPLVNRLHASNDSSSLTISSNDQTYYLILPDYLSETIMEYELISYGFIYVISSLKQDMSQYYLLLYKLPMVYSTSNNQLHSLCSVMLADFETGIYSLASTIFYIPLIFHLQNTDEYIILLRYAVANSQNYVLELITLTNYTISNRMFMSVMSFMELVDKDYAESLSSLNQSENSRTFYALYYFHWIKQSANNMIVVLPIFSEDRCDIKAISVNIPDLSIKYRSVAAVSSIDFANWGNFIASSKFMMLRDSDRSYDLFKWSQYGEVLRKKVNSSHLFYYSDFLLIILSKDFNKWQVEILSLDDWSSITKYEVFVDYK